jgi:hypothetical protein
MISERLHSENIKEVLDYFEDELHNEPFDAHINF